MEPSGIARISPVNLSFRRCSRKAGSKSRIWLRYRRSSSVYRKDWTNSSAISSPATSM